MSFPTIPDIEPVIDIDFRDAVNLLLSSIAMEEMSLSKLMDAEHDKIQYALKRCQHGGCTLHDVTEVNKSAEDMMKTLIKLQMLLQFKLENVRELMPSTTTTTTTSTSTTTSTTRTCSTAANPCGHGCCLMGTVKGCMENSRVPFHGQPFSLHAFIPSEDSKGRAIRYTAGSERNGLCLYASGREVAVKCPEGRKNRLLLRGTARLTRFCRENGDISEEAAYKLTVREEACGCLVFRLRFSTNSDPGFAYDSGPVKADGHGSDLRMSAF